MAEFCLIAVILSENNPCAKMDCASGVLGFALALIMVAVYHWGKSEGKE